MGITHTNSVKIHRFRDYVAVTFDSGETLHMDVDMAANLSRALSDYAQDVRSRLFTDSTLGDATITGEGGE